MNDDLPDLRAIDVADVYKGDVLAGQLAREGNDVVFRYAAAYVANETVSPVARTLPLGPDPVRATAGSVPAFFAGLLPEGLRLRAIVTGTRTSEDDHLTLLLAVGQDAIGDVRVVPAGATPPPPVPTLEQRRVADVDLVEVFTEAISISSARFERRALPGVQAKVSAAMVSTPIGTSTGPAILKLNPPGGHPHLVENEHFFLTMAAACGLPAPVHRLVHDRTGRSGLLVARFDRVPAAGGRFRRLAQEDACQILGAYPAAKYRLTTEGVARALAGMVEEGDGSRPLALRRVFELVAFSYLIGNGDLHGKNFSARVNPEGIAEITPVYDLVSTQPYLSWRDPMALNLYGRAGRLTRGHLLQSAERLGLRGPALGGALDRICDSAAPWIERLDSIGFDDRTTALLTDLLRARIAELGRRE